MSEQKWRIWLQTLIRRVREIIRDEDLHYRLIALIAAVFLWFFAGGQGRLAIKEQVFSVPVKVINLPSDLTLINEPGEIRVVVRGLTTALARAERDLSAQVDLAYAQEGEANYPVDLKTPRGVDVVSVTPRTVNLITERILEKKFNVNLGIVGLPENFGFRNLTPKPNQVTIRGPRSQVERVTSAVAYVTLSGGTQGLGGSYPVRALDQEGRGVEGIEIDPAYVQVEFQQFEETSVQISLPVVPQFTGELPAGQQLWRTVITPYSLLVTATETAAQEVKQLLTAPISLTGLTEGEHVRNVAIIIPDGVQAVDQPTVVVTLTIVKVSQFQEQPLEEQQSETEEEELPEPETQSPDSEIESPGLRILKLTFGGIKLMERMFGTDGVRGIANQDLTCELAMQLGRAAATVLAAEKERPKILIGKDTRISGAMLEAALVAGITSVGADVYLLGVLPTPAVAYLTRLLKADAGIMISASHNPVEDNGIKIFATNGFKLSDQVEDEIENLIHQGIFKKPIGAELGRVYRQENAMELYIDFLLNTVDYDLQGLHIAIDCANGAASQVAPAVLSALGAKVSVINNEPNGVNINVNCGSTHADVITAYCKNVGADLGFTYDGDADRVLAVDEEGNLVDGDKILAVCGLHLMARNRLPHNKIAATVYSNGGLAQTLEQHGGQVVTTKAGDRYVLEAMLEQGLSLGGEQSGHLIFLDYTTTGDGVLSTLQLLKVIKESGKKLCELAKVMPVLPQVLKNVRVQTKAGWDQNPNIQAVIQRAQERLGRYGRIFVRASGTEPVIRVMGEHENEQLLKEVVDEVVAVVAAEQGGTAI